VSALDVAATVLTLTAALAYLNARILRLPAAIGLMALSLLGSIAVIALDAAGVVTSLIAPINDLLRHLSLEHVLLHGVLGLLLFAGALHIDLADLRDLRWPIALLAIVGTVLSTALVGVATWLAFAALGLALPLQYCLVFGALIAPTDPIAVLGILRSAGVPKRLETTIAGESLFNDGVGVVVFLATLGVASGEAADASGIAALFFREALGGGLFGLAVGYVGFRLLRSIDQYSVEVMMTLAMVVGGYAAAEALHVSAPIAAVVAGLLTGNQGRALAMSDITRQHVDHFWEMIDEILNAVLFLVIGLEVIHLRVSAELAIGAVVTVPIVLVARLVSVALPLSLMSRFRRAAARRASLAILTWAGLRGGISVALALSLPDGRERRAILVVTYVVVAFSVLVQGLTLGRLVRRLDVSAA